MIAEREHTTYFDLENPVDVRRGQVLLNGFSMSIPSMIGPVWRSSVRIFAALALDAAVTIRASQNEIL